MARAFFQQRFEDQRHALDVWRRVMDEPELWEAALLHDVGKVESDLGAIARSCATVMAAFGMATKGRWRSYLDHGEIGAEMLSHAGAADFTVTFTRHHPAGPPPDVDPRSWQLLKDADH